MPNNLLSLGYIFAADSAQSFDGNGHFRISFSSVEVTRVPFRSLSELNFHARAGR